MLDFEDRQVFKQKKDFLVTASKQKSFIIKRVKEAVQVS